MGSPTLDNSDLLSRLKQNFICAGDLPPEEFSLKLIGELLTKILTGDVALGINTPSITAAVASGSVAAGAKSVSFSSSSDFIGTILGISFPANMSQGFSAEFGKILAAIPYTVSAGTLVITKVI